jgi:hypothetical protein
MSRGRTHAGKKPAREPQFFRRFGKTLDYSGGLFYCRAYHSSGGGGFRELDRPKTYFVES